ncbi:MAG TPA: acyl-CoA dehydrogenase family protein [Alphaproteobacteria bacterium]|nr:acyl-CoA dehydrogenase family protein [Alphaproteobacteria bacterium]
MIDVYGLDGPANDWRQAAAILAVDVLAQHAAEVDAQARYPSEGMTALAHGGFYGLCLDVQVGGQGQGPATFAAVVEELARHCASTAMVYIMHVTAAKVIEGSTTFARRAEVLRSIAAGNHLTTLAFSEQGSRSQFWAPVSRLAAQGQGYQTQAVKSWVTAAHYADSYVASAQAPRAESPLQSTLYWLARTQDGVQPMGHFNGLGLRGNDSAPVELHAVAIADDHLLTIHGQGLDCMLQVALPWFSVGTAAMAHGLCLAAVEATAAHLQGTGFSHSGVQLRDLPNLRMRLAEMSVATEQSRAMLGHTLREMAAPDAATPLWVLRTRMAALQTALQVTDLAMKACGGAAFSRHLSIERCFRDARAGWVMAPTVDHLADFLGKAMTGLPLF